MAINRRQFIKRTASAVTVSVMLPKFWTDEARGQSPANGNRKIFAVIQLAGGNDGLNTVVPYTDSRYYSFRPTISFKDSELKDAQGASTVISNEFGLHPSLTKIKQLYDGGRVAIVLGVGYPEPNLSHFTSMDIWHTASVTGRGEGWLGKYADQALAGQMGVRAASIGGVLPKTLSSNKVVVPSVSSFESFGVTTDLKYPGNRDVQINTFSSIYNRNFPADSYLGVTTRLGSDSMKAAFQISSVPARYRSTVSYPMTPISGALKMVAEIITTIPEADLLYVTMGSFDHHGQQITAGNKLAGAHATLLGQFSEGVKAFYDDMEQHGLADNVLMMGWSEFGRRPNENGSLGTDHGTAAPMFIIGNPVRGGLYGRQPSLAVTDLDAAGNMKFTLDFRSVYATILDGWLGVDSQSILGGRFENVGFF